MKKTNNHLLNILLFILLCASTMARAQSFEAAPTKVGELPLKLVPESSGMAYEAQGQRLFHINDSGDGAFVYTTNLRGEEAQKWAYDSKKPKDVEDLAIGPCEVASRSQCLFVADMGDNSQKRSFITLTLLELKDFSGTEKPIEPYRVLKLEYPDRAHDAESLVVDPQGHIHILSKEWNEKTKQSFPSIFYHFDGNTKDLDDKEKHQLTKGATVDFRELLSELAWWAQVPTAMDVDFEKDLAFVLTYTGIIVIKWSEMIAGTDTRTAHTYVEGPELPQQEALVLAPGGLFYSTEYVKDYGPASLYFWSFD